MKITFFSPDNHRVVSNGNDHTIKVGWTIITKCQRRIGAALHDQDLNELENPTTHMLCSEVADCYSGCFWCRNLKLWTSVTPSGIAKGSKKTVSPSCLADDQPSGVWFRQQTLRSAWGAVCNQSSAEEVAPGLRWEFSPQRQWARFINETLDLLSAGWSLSNRFDYI